MPFLFFFFLSLFSFHLLSQSQTLWLQEWASATGSQNGTPNRVVNLPDASDYLYVAGSTANEYGNYDLLLTKFDDEGAEVWSETFNIPDTIGNVIVGDMVFNYQKTQLIIVGTVYNGPANNYDAFTVKFDTSGSLQWYTLYNGNGSHYDGAVNLYVDDQNYIFIAGGTTDSTEVMNCLSICYAPDGTPLWTAEADGYGLFDAATVIYRRSSTLVRMNGVVQIDADTWAVCTQDYNSSTGATSGSFMVAGNTDLAEIRDFAYDDNDNVYFTGYALNGANGKDMITIKINNGSVAWKKYYNSGGSNDDEANAIAVDASGNVYVAGYSYDSSEGRNTKIVKYNSSGTQSWTTLRNGEADADDEALDIAVDDDGRLYITGYVQDENTKDYFTEVREQSTGTLKWTGLYNGPEGKEDEGKELTLGLGGSVFVTGTTGTGATKTYTTVKYNREDILIPPDIDSLTTSIPYIQNRGQLLRTDTLPANEVKYYMTNQSPAMYFQDNRLSYVLSAVDTSISTPDTLHRVDITFSKSKNNERIYALDKREDFYNYYLGHIPEGRARVPLSNRLTHTNAFPGIDIQYYSNNAGLKYYFVCEPDSDPDDIELQVSGQDTLWIDTNGDLNIGTSLGDIILPRPEAFQVNGSGEKVELAWQPEFAISDTVVSLTSIGSYNTSQYLVFRVRNEPMTNNAAVDWITYFGSMGLELVTEMDLDDEDNLYISGYGTDHQFPIVLNINEFGNNNGKSFDAFIGKFANTGQDQFLTFFGGSELEYANDIVLNEDIYFIGITQSENLPADGSYSENQDGYIAKLSNADGSLIKAKYIGGNNEDNFTGITVDKDNNLWVVGSSKGNFPTYSASVAYNQMTYAGEGDGIIAKFSNQLESLWASYFGGNESDVISDVVYDQVNDKIIIAGTTFTGNYSAQNCTAPGDGGFPRCDLIGSSKFNFSNGNSSNESDAFLAEFTLNQALNWTTYFGGSGEDGFSNGADIAVDNFGNFAIGGYTNDISSFPVNPGGGYDQTNDGGLFLAIFENKQLTWLTGFGCTDMYGSSGEAVTYAPDGKLYFIGNTTCNDPADSNQYCEVPDIGEMPICPPSNSNSYFQENLIEDPIYGGGERDVFVSAFNNKQLLWSTYFGGNGYEIALSGKHSSVNSNLFFIGYTNSNTDFPLKKPNNFAYYQEQIGDPIIDGFIARLNTTGVIVSGNEPTLENSLKLFPNPTNSVVFLEFPSNYSKNTSLSIFDISGKLINYFPLMPPAIIQEINIDYLPAGIYFLKIQMENLQTITRKIIKIN